MVEKCPRCGSEKFVKRGLFLGKQRYKCSGCAKTFSVGVHSQAKKDFALFLYMNNNGIRAISRIVKVSPSVVLAWLKKAHEHLEYLFKIRPEKKAEVDVVELDEIYTYVKKNFKGQSYGLLIAENKSVLLRLTSEKE